MTHRPGLIEALECPSCRSRYGPQERFCAACKLPLVKIVAPGAQQPISDRHRQARKIKPQLAEGELVRAAWARNQAEAEFIQGLLLEEGVPSVLRRTAGFDVPDFLAAGPRDVMVPEAGAETAIALLRDLRMGIPEPEPGSAKGPNPLVLVAAVLGTGAVQAEWRLGTGRRLAITLNLGHEAASSEAPPGGTVFAHPPGTELAVMPPGSIVVQVTSG